MKEAIKLLKAEVILVREIAVRQRMEMMFEYAAQRLQEAKRLQKIVDLLEGELNE